MSLPRFKPVTGTVDGVNVDFSVAPFVAGTLRIWQNGQLKDDDLDDGFVEVDPALGTFRMNEAPETLDVLWAFYKEA